MILRINGDINRYYVQTLCMLFFKGAKFSQDELPAPDVPELDVTVYTGEDNCVYSHAKIKLGDKIVEADGIADPQTVVNCTPMRLNKLAVGRAIFNVGKAFSSCITPWGILTGVRPSKVASEFLFSGNGIRGTRQILRDEFFVNPKKAALAVSIATTEMKLTRKLPDNLCSIYISIPFCPSRCAYCSFVSNTSGKLLSLIDDYLETLFLDIDNIFSIIKNLGLKVATIYIGGGTPTVLSDSQLEKLMKRVSDNVDTSTLMEYSVEAGRPDTITAEKLRIIKEYGAKRISVNTQTLNDEILKSIGRRHTADDFYRAYSLARSFDIGCINVDLIAGLPNDTFGSFSNSIDSIISLAPENITVHAFSVKKAADLNKRGSGVYEVSEDTASKSVEYSQLKTKFAGYKPYYIYRQKNTVGNLENVGYSIDGKEGMYNIFMMEELHSIFAVGAGAVTKLVNFKLPSEGKTQIRRIFTPKYPYEYLRDAEKIRLGDKENGIPSLFERIADFYLKG